MSDVVYIWGLILVVVTFIITWFSFAAVYGVGVGENNPNPGKPSSGGGGPDYVYLAVNANPDRNQSTDQFTPGNFTVASHTLLTFIITNYDNGENVLPSTYYTVHGTVGNVVYLNGSSSGVGTIPTGQVAHTFTILDGAYAGFNIPLPAAGANPSIVQFSAYFNTTGTFTWLCMAMCDSWSMAAPGFMTGTITVV